MATLLSGMSFNLISRFFKTSAFSCNTNTNESLILYKYLLRQCERLPKGPKQHYKFMIKQSYKQHVKETDKERISQIISRAYEDAEWILKKYLGK